MSRYSVYIVRCGDISPEQTKHYYKIGISNDVAYRVRAIQVCCPYRISFVYSVSKKSKASAVRLENWVHSKLSEYWVQGEWFELDDSLIAKVQKYFSFGEGNLVSCPHKGPRKPRKHKYPKNRKSANRTYESLLAKTPAAKARQLVGLAMGSDKGLRYNKQTA